MDIESLLKSLNDHAVRHVVIGAAAFPVHGYARSTLDTDIFIEPTRENVERVHAALTTFGFDTSDLRIEDLLEFKVLTGFRSNANAIDGSRLVRFRVGFRANPLTREVPSVTSVSIPFR